VTSTFTADFREEYEIEKARWLRRRFLWYTGVVGVIGVLSVLATGIGFLMGRVPENAAFSAVIALVMNVVATGLYFTAFWTAYRQRSMARGAVLRWAYLLIVVSGVLNIVSTPIVLEMRRDEFREAVQRESGEFSQAIGTGARFSIRPDKRTAEDSPGTDGESPVVEGAEATKKGVLEGASGPREVDEAEVERAMARTVIFGSGLGNVFVTHLFACLFLPWTPRESFKPLLPLLVLNAGVSLVYVRLIPLEVLLTIVGSPVIAVPGLLICWWRHGRFKNKFHYRMLRGRYGEMRQELLSARQIHESLFPSPIVEGAVRMDYRYEPMRQIGGDYLYARMTGAGDEGKLHLIIIDVTGHGIGAALTVNRLAGEISRELGEHPDIAPGELLTGLNDYLHHTLATHSVYATAICVRVDPSGSSLSWASAGHPPAFLRAVDGRIERLDSTTLVLGACRGEDFRPNEQTIRFGPGDAVIAYTDGATEARNAEGRMLRVEGIQRIIASARPDSEGGWASALLRGVDAWRFGPPQDDTLIVEVWRPLR